MTKMKGEQYAARREKADARNTRPPTPKGYNPLVNSYRGGRTLGQQVGQFSKTSLRGPLDRRSVAKSLRTFRAQPTSGSKAFMAGYQRGRGLGRWNETLHPRGPDGKFR